RSPRSTLFPYTTLFRSADIEIPFERPGLGISRSTLDEIAARGTRVEQGCAVREVKRDGHGFVVDGIPCRVVIDAAGKLSRFTARSEEHTSELQSLAYLV